MTATPGAIHQIVKGMMGWDPGRPTRESQSVVVAGSTFSRTFKDQRPTHNKKDSKREMERERETIDSESGEQEGLNDSEEPMWPSTDYPYARPPTEQKAQSKGFPGERL